MEHSSISKSIQDCLYPLFASRIKSSSSIKGEYTSYFIHVSNLLNAYRSSIPTENLKSKLLKLKLDLEQWLSGEEHLRLFERTWVRSSAPVVAAAHCYLKFLLQAGQTPLLSAGTVLMCTYRPQCHIQNCMYQWKENFTPWKLCPVYNKTLLKIYKIDLRCYAYGAYETNRFILFSGVYPKTLMCRYSWNWNNSSNNINNSKKIKTCLALLDLEKGHSHKTSVSEE